MTMIQAWFGTAALGPNTPGLFAWGPNNIYGSFGNNTHGPGNYTSTPSLVSSLTTWSSISSAAFSVAAIRTDGTLWTWGLNNFGQLGLNNRTNYSSPKQVGSLTNWANVTMGVNYAASPPVAAGHCLAVKTDGTLWAWGNNQFGQLGLGNTTSYSSPKQVGSATDWIEVSSLGTSTAARKNVYHLYTWGRNNYGQLGNGTTTDSSTPAEVVPGNGKVYGISSAGYHMAIMRGAGFIYSWGKNVRGALGTGNTTNYSTPVVLSMTQFGFGPISATDGLGSGYGSSAAVKSTGLQPGQLWAWGNNKFGQLAQGTYSTGISSPVQVGVLTDWSTVSIGATAMLAIKKDKTMWACGVFVGSGVGNTGGNLKKQPINRSWTFVNAASYGNGTNFGINKP